MQISGSLSLVLSFLCFALHTPTSSVSQTSKSCLFISVTLWCFAWAPPPGVTARKYLRTERQRPAGLPYLFSFSQWPRSCAAPCLICENSCFTCLVQLSDCKSGIRYTIVLQSWSPRLPDINKTILDFLRLLGIWTIFFWLFSLSFTLSLNFQLFFLTAHSWNFKNIGWKSFSFLTQTSKVYLHLWYLIL